ncbi:hypothetical protein [Nocardioides aurantiacus]|uniref:hypothetical protein n=1 Tax=Nocardioides aurantiacus TaxID=86796 RepID=UPI0011CEC26E|nr:hypothetical protein [Nocardioides aurantiacus]
MLLSISYAALPRTDALRAWSLRLQGRNGQQRLLEAYTGMGAGLPVEMSRLNNGKCVCRGEIKRHVFYRSKRIEISFPATASEPRCIPCRPCRCLPGVRRLGRGRPHLLRRRAVQRRLARPGLPQVLALGLAQLATQHQAERGGRTAQELIKLLTVMESTDHGPQLCWTVMQSNPPQGRRPDISIWNWSDVTGHDSEDGTTWGDFTVGARTPTGCSP